jgi:hypothetical protein
LVDKEVTKFVQSELDLSNIKKLEVSISKKMHCLQFTDAGPLMLFRETVAVHSENFMKNESVCFGSCSKAVSCSLATRRCFTGRFGWRPSPLSNAELKNAWSYTSTL